MLTLDEAIKHCKEKAEELRKEASFMPDYSEDIEPCLECAAEHEQLAEWLAELKEYRKWREMMKTVYVDSSVLVMVKENDNGKP